MFSFLKSHTELSQPLAPPTSRHHLVRATAAEVTPLRLGPTQLDFEDLVEFERVENQYFTLGVQFWGAIAIRPSNPIFVPSSGCLVLMPSTFQAGIQAQFCRPVAIVQALVSGTRPVTLTALDSNGVVLERVSIGSYRYLWADGQAELAPLPQQPLQLQTPGIASILFESDAPFTLDNFFFSQL
ncbi:MULTISPECIES: hypothetical protein [Trichocoleus]|uniref:Uncharacterized protein n=1 Tax=Trichocoleus desertorum GB2-A4 TaxID=2933944 RepID=A0ABV0J4E3_9CYAN|nr:hypothetical protein [Trichocoleus sp. FACHB-46]